MYSKSRFPIWAPDYVCVAVELKLELECITQTARNAKNVWSRWKKVLGTILCQSNIPSMFQPSGLQNQCCLPMLQSCWCHVTPTVGPRATGFDVWPSATHPKSFWIAFYFLLIVPYCNPFQLFLWQWENTLYAIVFWKENIDVGN